MTKMVKSLGSLIFRYKLFVMQHDSPDTYLEETRLTGAGTTVAFVTTLANPLITLESRGNGWLTDTEKDSLQSMYDVVGAEYTLTYDDDTTDTVVFAYSEDFKFTPVVEGCNEYTATITLRKV